MNGIGSKVAENLVFVMEFAAVVFVLFLIAYVVEKRVYLRRHYAERILSTRKLALIGLFSAVSTILMLFEIPVPFAPPFYKIDLSELPILIKLIYAKEDLSVQVHPDDDYARRVEGSWGKTEMWYVLSARKGAQLVYGFSRDAEAEEIREKIREAVRSKPAAHCFSHTPMRI